MSYRSRMCAVIRQPSVSSRNRCSLQSVSLSRSPFHRHHELFGQSHRDGVVVIRFGETRSQRHIGQYDVVARYDVVIDILEAEIHAFPRAEDMDYALGMLHDIEVLIESMKNIQSFSCCSIRFPCLPICGTDVGKKPRNVKIYPPIL